jgi:hypothetical protein
VSRATSSIRVLQQLGGSFGIAILAVVLERQTSAQASDATGLATAYGNTFWWAVAFIALALVPTLLLPKVRRGVAKQSLEASPANA